MGSDELIEKSSDLRLTKAEARVLREMDETGTYLPLSASTRWVAKALENGGLVEWKVGPRLGRWRLTKAGQKALGDL